VTNPAIPEIGAWLEALHLGQYAQAFAEHDIDGTLLAQLSTDDLREIGIASLGHRKRILAAIAAARDGEPPSPSDPPDNPATSPADGERREVTILFADLCGFTALSRTLDPEELHDLVARYTAAVDRIVETYGGKVDKHIGDAVMALFGAPIAYGDDPLRAARCGLEIHVALAELGRQLGRSLEAHVGIASGEVVAGSIGRGAAQDYTVLGDSVNLAARLVALAKPGQTSIASETDISRTAFSGVPPSWSSSRGRLRRACAIAAARRSISAATRGSARRVWSRKWPGWPKPAASARIVV